MRRPGGDGGCCWRRVPAFLVRRTPLTPSSSPEHSRDAGTRPRRPECRTMPVFWVTSSGPRHLLVRGYFGPLLTLPALVLRRTNRERIELAGVRIRGSVVGVEAAEGYWTSLTFRPLNVVEHSAGAPFLPAFPPPSSERSWGVGHPSSSPGDQRRQSRISLCGESIRRLLRRSPSSASVAGLDEAMLVVPVSPVSWTGERWRSRLPHDHLVDRPAAELIGVLHWPGMMCSLVRPACHRRTGTGLVQEGPVLAHRPLHSLPHRRG